MTKKPLLALLLGLLPALLSAQGRDINRIFVEKYDLDATSTTYCVTGDAVARGSAFATTSGSSSTTVTAVSGTPFDDVAVGDTLYFNLPSGRVVRYITAKASGSEITVDTALTIVAAGAPFDYRLRSCGTAATDGWMSVENFDSKTIILQIDQLNVTGGISVKWQCKSNGDQAVAVDVYPGVAGSCPGGTLSSGFCNYTAVTAQALVIDEAWYQCRVGMKIGSADDGTDTGSAAEIINIYFLGRKEVRP